MTAAKLRVMVVDDEPLARQTIRLLLDRIPDVETIAEVSGFDAVAAAGHDRIDILFLDIQMPEVDGFELLRRLTPTPPAVVFVTAYDQHALRAFELHAVDYLLKPFDDARFFEALQRARDRVRDRSDDQLPRIQALLADLAGRGDRYLRRILVPHEDHSVLLQVAEIDWIEAADYYARIHSGSRNYLVRQSLSSLEQQLDPAMFFRVHRSGIVNLDRIREVHPQFKGDAAIVLHNGKQLALSRSRREEFERLIARLR